MEQKDNRFYPFSNGTEYRSWQCVNCENCKKYENESEKVEDAGCPMAFYLDLGSVTDGTIPTDMAERIGIDGDCLADRCKEFETE